MENLSAIAPSGASIVLAAEIVQAFAANLRGQLILPSDADYDQARKVWNGMIDKRPALIARCSGVADIIHCVNFARNHKLIVAVRGGGHNVAGNAVCEGGITIDLSNMKSVRVDPAARTARAEPGATWGDLDRETQVFGLATPGGQISTTGIAGLTLGGGIGWLMGKHGLSCDNLLSIDLVTAQGKVLTASATQNSDLFWGIRGGGGNFGIVTSFEYQLHPVSQILGGHILFPIEKAQDILQFFRIFTRDCPDELVSMAVLVTLPDRSRALEIALCYNGAIAEGEQIIQPLREKFGPPLLDRIAPMPYTTLQSMTDDEFPPGRRTYWKSSFLNDLSDEVIDLMLENFMQTASPYSVIGIDHLCGAVHRVGHDDTAFNNRNSPYSLLIAGIWDNPIEDNTQISWVRHFWHKLHPYLSEKVYVNYLGQETDEGIERIKAAYGSAKYERLVALKNKYDPTNLFRLNQNIKPTAP